MFTLFPEAVAAFVKAGLLGKAAARGLVEIQTTNYRDFTADKHRSVDDAPFGGGPGMVIKVEPVVAALEHVEAQRGPMHRILLTPSAPRFDQRAAERLARVDRIGLLCGRYEGIDDRVRERFVDACYSIGDFVLNGGEVGALAIVEAVSRLREGILGNPESARSESFATTEGGVDLEHPHYTRPAVFRGHGVPKVLLGGNHQAIASWRRSAARARTLAVRPDLRASSSLPACTEVHVAVPATVQPSEAYVDVLRAHGVASLVALGARADGVMPWIEATRGRIPVAGFDTFEQLRRRIQQRRGVDPLVVGLVPSDVRDEELEISRDPATVLAAWAPPSCSEGEGRPVLIVVLAPSAAERSAVAAVPGHALLAPIDVEGGRADLGAQTQGQTLATCQRIEDSSPPPGLCALRRALAGLLTYPTGDGQSSS